LVACEQLDQALGSRQRPVWMPTTPLGTGQRTRQSTPRAGPARIGGFPRARLGRGKRRLEISPRRTRGEIARDTHNCTAPSLSAVTAPLTSHQPLSPWTHCLCLRLLRFLCLPLWWGGLWRGPASSSTATRKTSAGRRSRLDRPQSRCSDGRRRTR
jgi:hypothetical protein